MAAETRIPRDPFWRLARAAARLLCPVCKKGRIFPRLMTMADACPECGTLLTRESGYFLGSIYFNYGVTVTIAGVIYFGILFGLDGSAAVALWTSLAFAALFPLWFWRYARSLWLLFDQYLDPRVPPRSR